MQRLATPLSDAEIHRLDELLASIHAPLQPMDACAVDGYLCGLLLQPVTILWREALAPVFDLDGRGRPPPALADEIAELVGRRHDELAQAIGARQWFDPWIFETDDDEPPAQAQLLWVAGFAEALERHPQLLALRDPALREPLAVLFACVDPQDLEDADDLLPLIETLEPPATLDEAAEDLVRSVLLLADVSRPRASAPGARAPRAGRPGGARPGGRPARRPPGRR